MPNLCGPRRPAPPLPAAADAHRPRHVVAVLDGVDDRLLPRDDRRHGQPETLDPCDQVAPQPLRALLRQRRDDDLVEVALTHRLLDGAVWLGPTDEALDL